MKVFYCEEVIEEFYHEDLVDKVQANFTEDMFDEDNDLHIYLPEDYQLFDSLKHLSGTFLSQEDVDELP